VVERSDDGYAGEYGASRVLSEGLPEFMSNEIALGEKVPVARWTSSPVSAIAWLEWQEDDSEASSDYLTLSVSMHPTPGDSIDDSVFASEGGTDWPFPDLGHPDIPPESVTVLGSHAVIGPKLQFQVKYGVVGSSVRQIRLSGRHTTQQQAVDSAIGVWIVFFATPPPAVIEFLDADGAVLATEHEPPLAM
jgi:hypothetical protein